MDSRRFMPYAAYSAHPNLRWNVEEGLSAQILRPIHYDTPPTIESTGASSETTANAEQNQTITEEGESPVSNCY